jgi:hypothetical protein
MKTRPFKQPRKSKPTVQLKDIKPKKDPKGGRYRMFSIVDRTNLTGIGNGE